MKPILAILSIILSGYFFAPVVIAQTSQSLLNELADCQKIENKTDRLGCFDQLVSIHLPTSAEAKNIELEKPQLETSVAQPETSVAAAKAIAKTTTKPSPSAANPEVPKENLSENSTPPAVSKAEQDFGKKQEQQPQSINSRVIGQFKKWRKGQKLRLENGQVWVVKRASSGYKKMDNPKITITEDFFGGFTAKVEGLNATAKVRRVK